jgi:L-rhamnose isomerase
MAESPKQMEQAYSLAKERYAALGVDVEADK